MSGFNIWVHSYCCRYKINRSLSYNFWLACMLTKMKNLNKLITKCCTLSDILISTLFGSVILFPRLSIFHFIVEYQLKKFLLWRTQAFYQYFMVFFKSFWRLLYTFPCIFAKNFMSLLIYQYCYTAAACFNPLVFISRTKIFKERLVLLFRIKEKFHRKLTISKQGIL